MTPSRMGAPPGGMPEQPVTDSHDAPPESLALLIWRWYGEEQYRRLILLGELGPALQFLARDAEWQGANIGCCADCNLWSDHLRYLHAFVHGFPPRLLPRVHAHLQALLGACEAPERTPTSTWTATTSTTRNGRRCAAAQEALALLLWQEFEAHMPALVEDCQAALEKWQP